MNTFNKSIFTILVLFIGFLSVNVNGAQYNNPEEKYLTVYFFDVGQGDATLLVGPDFTILIDAGRHDRNNVEPYLRQIGIEEIDLLIGTHPHADHIGQFPRIIDQFTIGEIWMSGDIHTTRTFERTIDAIEEHNLPYYEPRAGETFNYGSAFIEVIHPQYVNGDLNDGSIVTRITYGEIVFLFTGDAELRAEDEMVHGDMDIGAHILKMGHHGSRTSSSYQFLNAVNPEIAIYSAGIGNSYNHPHPDVINRVKSMGITIYGTDINGSVIVKTDGIIYETAVTSSDVTADHLFLHFSADNYCGEIVCQDGFVCHQGGCFRPVNCEENPDLCNEENDPLCVDVECAEGTVCYEGSCLIDCNQLPDACI
ncbi:MAG: MBL fold metallo-hydrolase [Balneolaceae bacterium]|nr:MBL fold metallo-hydrolase [Balneolaceae bacterium]